MTARKAPSQEPASTDQLPTQKSAPSSGQKPVRTIEDYIRERASILRDVLPRELNADRLIRLVTYTIRTNPRLMEATIPSVLGAVMQAASLGLEPGVLGQCYFVPFRNTDRGTMECQFIVGYRGYVDLAYRSGQVKSIVARDVRAGDYLEVNYGTEDKIVHRPMTDGVQRPAVGYYAVVHLTTGGTIPLYLTLAEVEHYRQFSQAKDSGPWKTHYDAMARKTVLRRLVPYLPMTPSLARAYAHDEQVIDADSWDIIDAGLELPHKDVPSSSSPQAESETAS
jgi:recombination protein RecT